MDSPDKLQHVLDRLPRRQRMLRERMLRDPTFRSICEDYGTAVEALTRWEASGEAGSRARADEFRQLVQDLEAEILVALDTG